MILWTVQNRALLDGAAPGNAPTTVAWPHTPYNWRFLYRWMATQWGRRIGPPVAGAPIWCWHSCGGLVRQRPSVEALSSLLGDWAHYQPTHELLTVDVPSELALLSSYARWNRAIERWIERDDGTCPGGEEVFERPLFDHPTDDIQAVVPYLRRDWVVDRQPLPPSDEPGDRLLGRPAD